jgi:hypothetical protein
MLLNRVIAQTLRVGLSEPVIIDRVLESRKFKPALDGSWPSLDQVLGYMGYRADEFPLDQDVKHSLHLTKQIMDNFKEMNRLWSYQEPSFEEIGLKPSAGIVSSFESSVRRYLFMKERKHLLADPVFIHTTGFSNAEQLLQSNGEFNDQYFSTSLFDPNQVAKVFRLSVGLILDVPQESIIAASDSECVSKGNHSFLASSYQIRAVNNYIRSLLINAKIESVDSDLKQIRYHLWLNRLGDVFREDQVQDHENRAEKQRRDFSTLFRRKGMGIAAELQHIHDVADQHLHHMLDPYREHYFGCWHQAGQFEDRKTLTSRVCDSYFDADHNEVLVHSPWSCREFGLKPPKIKGVLMLIKQPSRYVDSWLSLMAKKHRLPIFYHPKVLRDF